MGRGRKSISKKVREQVYLKYNGHCAYCGCRIAYKEMQVDHLKSFYVHVDLYENQTANEINEIDNLMPSCRMCNFYKSTLSIEDFRKRIETISERLNELFIFKLAKKYGIVQEKSKKIKFYFERLE